MSSLSFDKVNGRGKIIKETIHMICEWMKKIKNFEKSIALLVTGLDQRKNDVDDIVDDLNGFRNLSNDALIQKEEKKMIKDIV